MSNSPKEVNVKLLMRDGTARRFKAGLNHQLFSSTAVKAEGMFFAYRYNRYEDDVYYAVFGECDSPFELGILPAEGSSL